MSDYMPRAALFTAFVDSPDYAHVLAEIDGAMGVTVFDVGLGNWLVSTWSLARDREDFEAECEQVIEDARRVSWLLDGVELGEW